MNNPDGGDPTVWSRYGRSERLRLITESMRRIVVMKLTAENLSATLRNMEELEAVLDSCEERGSFFSSMHPDMVERNAYRSRREAYESLSSAVHADGFAEDVEQFWRAEAVHILGVLDDRPVVWFVDSFPDGDRRYEILVYLSLSQLGIDGDRSLRIGRNISSFNASAGIIVRTPRWVVAFIESCTATRVDTMLEMGALELDYLRGMRRDGWAATGLGMAGALRVAGMLARAQRMRSTL